MSQTILDPCLFFKRKEFKLTGFVGTLVDDTIACSDDEFSNLESKKSSAFDVKPGGSKLAFCFGGVSIKNFVVVSESTKRSMQAALMN